MANYVDLGRTAIQSHLRMAADNLPPEVTELHLPSLQDFDRSQHWEWLKKWLAARYRTDIESLVVPELKRCVCDSYPQTGERGHYDLAPLAAPDGSIRIAITGDWGTGTDESQTIADNMVLGNPELTIHLGDVYYVGEADEVRENCLGVAGPLYKGVTWRHGSKGSFALTGNHEMYSGGHGYFEVFLPTLGIPTSQDKQQLRSYFCLETPVWRILAIDTGYNSDTLLGSCKLEDNVINWLRTVIDPAAHKKPTILLSHHQWFSGFGDGEYHTPANQMAEFLRDQEFVWIWGHEHRLAIFNKFSGDNGLTTYARCIGHGGMPVTVADPSDPLHTVEYYDSGANPNRTHVLDDGTTAGLNGYMLMTVHGPTGTLEYLDINRNSLLTETFEPAGGDPWNGRLNRTVTKDPGILRHLPESQI
jgi:hypothetical protein